MTTREPTFPPHIMAALRSPQGTTAEDIYRQFPHARPTYTPPPIDHTELNARLHDAHDDWHRRHGWHIDMPQNIKEQLAQQIRDDLIWEQR
ncbi:hypothetical protein [Nocardia sp. 348MFTsu5.1]|uniref:hypothetical protein n=1 Tax=Nocardia sp. 348MFTsu5.1 TaxID=1172185 RepID=UPI0012DE42FE|nr:hypothetical protein [Nocardia sp. 348MFTsu5.1]